VLEIDRVNAFGQVVERDFVGGVPRMVSGFPGTTVMGGIPTVAAPTVLGGIPASTVVGGVGEIDRVNAFGQVVERDFVGGVPRVVGGFPASTVVGGVGEIDRVNAFGQVVERDFVGGVPRVIGGMPATTVMAPQYAAPATVMAAPTVYGGVGEIDRVNAFGQVVERDFVGGAPIATLL